MVKPCESFARILRVGLVPGGSLIKSWPVGTTVYTLTVGTVSDYFAIDFPHAISFDNDVQIDIVTTSGEQVRCPVQLRTYAVYEANATFLSAYISHPQYAADLAESILEHADEVAAGAHRTVLGSGLPGDPPIHGKELRFAGRVFLYMDADIRDDHVEALVASGKSRGLAPIVRGRAYASARTREDKPVAFISYDSRDKSDIARPLAQRLATFGCPVWFDEFSLRVGDSLRESIERGLRECEKCILIVSSHFLSNAGWTKAEFNAIFTREVHEQNHVILPVWVGVSKDQVYQYSPTLADRYAVTWDRGIEEVVQEIRRVVGP